MNCPECQAELERTIRNADAFFVPPEMRPAGLFARIDRCWECGRNEAIYATLTLRPVTLDDAERVYAWRDAEVLRQSYSMLPVRFEEHKRWMETELQEILPSPSWWMMGELAGDPVGHIRIAPTGEISITVTPVYRGVGIGAALLRLANRGDAPLLARVKGGNIASQRAFEKAGWGKKEVIYER